MTITVSMQPGDNYRAMAVLDTDTRNQVTQADADTPPQDVVFTDETLTIWRKLWVERDTMAGPSAGATWVTGTVSAIVPNSPVAGQATIDLGQNLADEFSDLNLYEGGEIVFHGCPQGSDTFDVLLSTSNTFASDSVTVVGIPGSCAAGSSYTLKDDDNIGVLPHLPDFGQFGIDAFARAYILPVYAGAGYQTEVSFNMQMQDWEIQTGLGWNDGRTLSSSASFWSCLIVAAWEPSEDNDYDPDPCPAPAVPGGLLPKSWSRCYESPAVPE